MTYYMDISEGLKEKAIKDIVYEIDMFRNCIKFGSFLRRSEDLFDKLIDNLLIEGVAQHTRVLYDFFYQETREKDNILAKDYIDENWHLFLEKRTSKKDFDSIIKKCNKQLAHLAYSRVTQYDTHDKGWDFIDISKKIEKNISVFVEALPSSKKEWFTNLDICFKNFDNRCP